MNKLECSKRLDTRQVFFFLSWLCKICIMNPFVELLGLMQNDIPYDESILLIKKLSGLLTVLPQSLSLAMICFEHVGL